MEGSGALRITRNTVIIYIRMAVTIIVGLITSSLVLKAIGAGDVGIYSTVGSTVLIVSCITGALTATTVRFMNIEIGKGGDTGRIFNICNVIHLGGAVLLFVILESLGLWYILSYINIPPGREADTMFVFQVSTVVACIGVANVPFQSMFTVHEKFGTIAAVDIFNAIVKLGLILLLVVYKGNGLRMYAIMMSASTLIAFVVYHALCHRLWPDTVKWKFVRGWAPYREVLSFNNWNLLWSTSIIARTQGSNILINWFFNPVVNAAYYYAATVQNYVNQFIGNIDTAAAPQITQGIGSGDTERPIRLAKTVCRLCILLFLLLYFPLNAELKAIIDFWLQGRTPPDTVRLCRITLLVAAVSSTSAGLGQIINAYGKIKWFRIIMSALYLSCLVAGWFLFKAGNAPESIVICFVAADVLSRTAQFILLRKMFSFDVWGFIRDAYARPLVVAVIMGLWLVLYNILAFDTAAGRIFGFVLTGLLTAAAIWFIGLEKSERKKALDIILRRKNG